MKNYVIWLILLHLCCCENLDYTDYHPETIPLQAENPSPQYKAVMRNLRDNWHSPISYLKKRGYMPKNIPYEPKRSLNKKKINHQKEQNLEKGENYFFFPDNKEQKTRNSIMLLENNDQSGGEKPNTQVTESTPPPPVVEEESKNNKNDTTGIINKVKDKFLSIFSHKDKSKSGEMEEDFNLEDPEILENYNDEYELTDRRLFARSVPTEKPLKLINSSISDGILSNLTDTEIYFIKSFINWFKQNKDNFRLSSSSNSNITTSGKSPDTKDSDSKTGSVPKPEDKRPSVQSSTESGTKSLNITTECTVVGSEPVSPTTVKTTKEQSFGAVSKNSSATTNSSKDDFTVDLDINQKNGTGEEILPKTTQSVSSPIYSDRNKYVTKSKFLAHLHHMVDEVGKPPHKPLDLAKIQHIIDNSKKLPTVTMGGDKTTQCAPLRLNDMSFDLEWNKINTVPHNGRQKLNIFDLPYEYQQPQGQSLAAKFLQEVNSYPGNSDEYLKTPYTDNFLDSQQSLPSDLDLPLKSSTKREVGFPSFGKKVDIYSFPDTNDADEKFEESPKRRIKGRVKGRNKKKPKHKNNDIQSSEPNDIYADDDNRKEGTDFNSFDELRDIQFRVNNNDEEAISTFISSLNAPPEVFSFDVDKYLRTAKQEMEPKAPEFEYKSPEPRTYYEFLESPSIENERLPLIEPLSSEVEAEPVVEKRSRASTVGKRDLLRQYIKGVSSALNHNFDDIYSESCNKDTSADKLQRSPSLDEDIQIRTDNLIDGFSTNLDAMDSINSKENNNADDSLNNYFLLNDGGQAYDESKPSPEVIPNDYSPQSLEIDLDLDKKFRDLNIGKYNNEMSRSYLASVDSKNVDAAPQNSREIEANDLESMDNDPH